MTINGLDISMYQEIEWQNKYIDWQALANDPRDFQYIWIKAAEGELAHPSPDAYPVYVFDRQVAGAKSAGCFKQINPYHFYYYQVPWDYDENGNIIYYVLSPTKQAEALAAALQGVKYVHPLTDIEAPHVIEFMLWNDTESANKAIAFARKLNAHLKKYHEEVTRLCGKPDIYTGAWWWDVFASLLIDNGYASELEWAKSYKFYIANYTPDGPIIPVGIPRENILAWQYTSTPKVPVLSIPTSNNVDMADWVGTEIQWKEWSGQEIEEPPIGEPMASTYNTHVLQKDRSKMFTLEINQTITVPYEDLGTDVIILPMGGMPVINGYCKPMDYASFGSRCFEASKVLPVIGQFELSAGNWLKGNLTAGEAEKPFKTNIITKEIIDAWHNGDWTWDNILSGVSSWRNLSALEFKLVDTEGPSGSLVSANWQNRILDTILNHIIYLQTGGFIPKIPVILYTGPWWLSIYDLPDTEIYLTLQKNKSWLYLRLGQWVRYSTATFDKLEDVFAFPPEDTFVFEQKDATGTVVYTYPDNYFDRIVSHEWSGAAQKVKTVVDSNNIPTPVSISSSCDTKENTYKFLNFTGEIIIPPPVEPPTPEGVTNAQILKEIKILEAKIETLWYSVFKR